MKKLYIILLMVLLIPIVYGICCEKGKKCIISETCQDAACGNCRITVYNRTGIIEIPQADMSKISSYTYTFNISKDTLTYGTYPYAINCTNNKICQGECKVEVMQECEGENEEFYLYIISLIIFFILVGIGYAKEIAEFVMISGILAMIIGIVLIIYGFPNLTSVFLRNSIAVIFWGVGAYLILEPAMDFFERWKD